MNLYIDIGNTNIKISHNDKVFLFKSKMEHTADSLYSSFPDKLKNIEVDKVYASNVVPSLRKTIETLVERYYDTKIFWVEQPLKNGIKIDTENPKNVGSDLVALSVFAASKSDESIIVNLGTATTISYIKDKSLKGVIIAPGIEKQYKSLIEGADQLNDINLKYVNKPFGKNTADSISIGIINGHIQMIKGLIEQISNTADVIISGGNMFYIKDRIKAEYVNEATIEGIKIIGDLNDNK